MATQEQKIKWKAAHRCANCSRPLPEGDTRIRCEKCRGYQNKQNEKKKAETKIFSKGYYAGKKFMLKKIKELLNK